MIKLAPHFYKVPLFPSQKKKKIKYLCFDALVTFIFTHSQKYQNEIECHRLEREKYWSHWFRMDFSDLSEANQASSQPSLTEDNIGMEPKYYNAAAEGEIEVFKYITEPLNHY